MANFELSIISFSEKARLAMKIDMVNPMPANIEAPHSCFQLLPSGSVAQPLRINHQHNKRIPNCFPMNKPAMMPKLLLVVNPSYHPLTNGRHVLAIANNGNMINATGLCKKCCSL